jgi:hypothetical protein
MVSTNSDPAHRAARIRHVPWLDKKRFRENDELRYSMRSFLHNTVDWKEGHWHLVSNSYADDLPSGIELQPGYRLGQIPQWLRLNHSSDGLLLHHGRCFSNRLDLMVYHLRCCYRRRYLSSFAQGFHNSRSFRTMADVGSTYLQQVTVL